MEMEMDMDMDMDIPLPDELELLEANYHLHEDWAELEQQEPDPEEYIEEDRQPTSASKSPPSTHHQQSTETQVNGHKRLRPVDETTAGPSDEKRSRIDDEDWLRYSPPPQESDPIPMVEERTTADAVEEKIVWRYASEIDGDFIPVTAPSLGDRVYAKISRVEMEERPQRGQSGGRTKFLLRLLGRYFLV